MAIRSFVVGRFADLSEMAQGFQLFQFHPNFQIVTSFVTYPLPAIATNEEKFEAVQYKVLASLLRKMGAARHSTPVPIRHGPVKLLGGLNLLDIHTELGISPRPEI